MDIFTISLWGIAGLAFLASILKDSKKTFDSIKIARGMMKGMIGEIIAILFLIGLILTFIPPETIKELLGKSDMLLATIAAALAGSVTLIPAFVAFPLVGSFVNAGASTVPAVAFLTTLTMVGIVTFPLEKQEFGLKFTLTRNAVSFIFAVLIAISMGVAL